MLRKKELFVVLLVGALCFSVFGDETKFRTITRRDPQTGKTERVQVPITDKEVDPYENTSVLVEAFMVRVSTEALAEVGVNSIGQAPESISILKILSCLDDPEKAEVISGAKVAARNKNQAVSKNSETFYIKRESVNNDSPIDEKSVTFDPYSSGKNFTVIPRIQPDGTIRLEATYSDTGIIENDDRTIPPVQLRYDWSGVLSMESGIPMIAGASQNNDTMTFLILTATIQDIDTK